LVEWLRDHLLIEVNNVNSDLIRRMEQLDLILRGVVDLNLLSPRPPDPGVRQLRMNLNWRLMIDAS
jgi:hypothetical protein